jgi:perosamine synthetase
MGCAQLERIGEHIADKRRIARRYDEHFSKLLGIRPMQQAAWAESVFWLYTILLDSERFPDGSRPLMHMLDSRGIQTRPLWQPVHLSPAHTPNGARCSVAEHLQRNALSIPSSVGLTEEDQQRVIEGVGDFASASATHALTS